jgi:hypothetical protein
MGLIWAIGIVSLCFNQAFGRLMLYSCEQNGKKFGGVLVALIIMPWDID